MYNGIGLQTPRGSGTNGYVQRNMSFVPKSREKVNYRTEEDIKKLDALANKKPNEAILAHERKRLVELKCFEMQELMEDQGYPEEEIESKVALFRKMLLEKEDCGDEREMPKDAFGRPIVKESHQMAEANQEKNLKMREALGISQYFVEGSSLDPARKAKEAAAAAAEEAKKKYALIPDSSSSSPERTVEKEKVKKRKKKKSLNTHEKLDSVSSAKKKKSSKKHKKDRSVSPEHHKKKKSKKTTKDKLKHKSKKSRTRSSSSSSVVSSSSSADDESSSRSSSVSSLSDAQSDGSSYERHKHSSKADRNPKSHKKHSLSPESALYTKDSRSRKDLYEAKKGKHKRKSGRSPTTSTSEDDSSPKQYYRLEPVLLKSKTKHKKTRQFIEVPKKSTYELKKKKRVYDSSTSSSSSSATKSKSRSKCRKRSSSPDVSKSSKYHFSRNEDTPKRTDSSKSSKRHPKGSCSSEEKMQSQSPEILHKSKHKKNIPEDGSKLSRRSKNKAYDDKNGGKYHKSSDKHLYKRTCSTSPEKSHAKKKYESPKKRKDVKKSPKHRHPVTKLERKDKNYSESPKQHRSHKASSESLFRCQGRNSKSPNRHNGRSRSPSVVSGYSPGGPSSFSPFNEERFFTRSPSLPPKYKHKKHILNESPPYSSQTVSKNKISPKSSEKCTARAVISGRSTSRSVSPDRYYPGKSKQRHSISPQVCSTKKVSQKRQSPDPKRARKRSKSKTSSPELDAKQRKVYGDRSYSSSASNSTPDGTQNPFPWKSKGEMKDVTVQSKNLCVSPKEISLKSSRNSPLKGNISPDRKSPKTFEKSPPATNSSSNADVFQTMPNTVKRKLDDQQGTTEDMPNKIIKLSPGGNKNSNSDNEKIFFNIKSISIPHPPPEDKTAVETSQARTEKALFCPQDSESVNSSEKKASDHSQKGAISKSKDLKRSKTPELRAIKEVSYSRSRSTSAARSCSLSDRSSSYSKSHSYSRSKSRSKSFSRSRSKSYSRSRSRSASLYSRSRSRSYSSRSRSRSIARSPSIPRRRGSPSFLDKRRITSARKRPVPYRRPSPPTPSSSEEGSSWSYRSVTPSSASSPRSYNSPIQATTPFIHSFDNRV